MVLAKVYGRGVSCVNTENDTEKRIFYFQPFFRFFFPTFSEVMIYGETIEEVGFGKSLTSQKTAKLRFFLEKKTTFGL